MSGNVTLDLSGLEKYLKKMKTRKKARVGVLAGDSSRTDDSFGNASIGLVMELGSTINNIPPRSFIRMPLETHVNDMARFMQTPRMKEHIENGESEQALGLLGIYAENIIQDAFSTGGFGKWAALKQSTIDRKGSSAKLIDTSQLRRSISSEVK